MNLKVVSPSNKNTEGIITQLFKSLTHLKKFSLLVNEGTPNVSIKRKMLTKTFQKVYKTTTVGNVTALNCKL